MKQFALNSKEIYRILNLKGINFFHHVNTFQTSKTFIENNGLLSRKYVEENNLIQTHQESDELDRQYGVFDDVFVDGLDLHEHFNRNSPYGPIMFKIDLKILTVPDFSEVYITKDNPTNWHKRPNLEDRYYENIGEFESEYRNGSKVRDGQIMFTFKNSSTKLKLNKFCREIIVDNPHILSLDKSKSLGPVTFDKIHDLLKGNRLGHVKLTLRHPDNIPMCWCVKNYNAMKLTRRSRFDRCFF